MSSQESKQNSIKVQMVCHLLANLQTAQKKEEKRNRGKSKIEVGV
jgi:hypothetical protein